MLALYVSFLSRDDSHYKNIEYMYTLHHNQEINIHNMEDMVNYGGSIHCIYLIHMNKQLFTTCNVKYWFGSISLWIKPFIAYDKYIINQ